MARLAVSFVTTLAVTLPAALDANIDHDGKKLRPIQQAFTVDGTTIQLDVDHALIHQGDRVIATLVAKSDVPKQVKVDLRVLRTHNYQGERVSQPTVTIDRETITLAALPGGGIPIKTSIVLGTPVATPARVDDYKIYVSMHGDGIAKNADHDYGDAVEAGTAAAASVTGWSGDNLKLTIEPEGPIVAGEPFVVAIRVKNTSGSALVHDPVIDLGTQISIEGILTNGDAYQIGRIDNDDGAAEGLGRNKEKVARYTITPNDGASGPITLIATANAWDEAPGPVVAGAFEVHTFPVTAPTPSVAAK